MDYLNKIPLPALIITGGFLLGWGVLAVIIKLSRLGLKGTELSNFVSAHRKIKLASFIFLPVLIIFLAFSLYHGSENVSRYVFYFQIALIFTGTWFLIRLVYVFEAIILSHYDNGKDDNTNAKERKVMTQLNFLKKIVIVILSIIGLSAILLSFEEGRKFGAGLITSAGILSVIVGFAAQKTIANLLAGLQIAFTQPIKIDDVVIVENEWGRIEEINLTYVVVKVWDLRRLVIPITYFVEKPFQNWTRTDTELVGVVFIYADFRLPVDALRGQLAQYLPKDPLWDGRLSEVQVTNATASTMEVRIVISARNASDAFDLRCNVREMLIAFIRDHYPDFLPVTRVLMQSPDNAKGTAGHSMPLS